MKRFHGKKDPDRRIELEEVQGALVAVPADEIDYTHGMKRDGTISLAFQEYRKTATVYAVRIDEPFEVDTLEGLHSGKAGDFLAVGVAGEMYPIDGAVMAASYEAAK